MITKEQTKAALQIMMAVAETIREMREVPSGVLYAHLMGKMNLEQYNSMLGVLERNKLITVGLNHVIHWTGPQFSTPAAS